MKGKQNAYSLQQNKKFVLDKGYSLLTANGITYIQRAAKKEKQNQYVMPNNVFSVADYIELLVKRDIFVDLLTDKEVCDMTMAQFSRDDILLYQGREEGREEGERIGELRGEIGRAHV